MYHILIVDDDPDIRTIVQFTLEKDGYKVSCAENGEEALNFMETSIPDLVLLDVMMPIMDGIQTCEAIKANPLFQQVIISFLTARAEDYSQIAGLDAGGDDYITKPIKPKLLSSRIHALLRRKSIITLQNRNESKGIEINRDRYMVYLDGQEIQLPRKEFELLALLFSKPNTVFKRENILKSVWGTEIVVGDRTIDVHVRKLREKLGNHYISTVKGIGYKYNQND